MDQANLSGVISKLVAGAAHLVVRMKAGLDLMAQTLPLLDVDP